MGSWDQDCRGLAPLRPGSSNAMRRPGAQQSQQSQESSATKNWQQSQQSHDNSVGRWPQGQQSQDSSMPRGNSPSPDIIPGRPQSQCSAASKNRNSTRRKLLCNWGAQLGQQSLLSVKVGMEPIRAPYNVSVCYDLRPVLRSLVGVEGVYLAALDTERLRRKGAGIGLDALTASENWIARDCICTKSGKLRPLSAWKCPGKINLSLQPFPTTEQETCILLRIIAVRFPYDPQDWHAIGAAVVLRVDTVGKMLQSDSMRHPQQSQAIMNPTAGLTTQVPEEGESACWGIRMQQLLDFRQEIARDVDRYCSAHCICLEEGEHKFFHVCMYDPCPHCPLNQPKFDDHRGVPFVQQHRLAEGSALCPLVPNVSFVVRRYIIAPGQTDNSAGLLVKARVPLKVGAYITHTGADSFTDFVETLEQAFDPDDSIFISSFARAQGALDEQTADLDDMHPCARALQSAEKLVVVVDKSLSFTQCLWCNYEIKWAREWKTAAYVWPHRSVELGELQESVGELDLGQLVSSNPEDEYNFRKAIDGKDLDLRQVSQQLREFLQERIVSYAAAFQGVASLKEVSPEKVRRLHVEHERRTAIKEFEKESQQVLCERDYRIELLEKELSALQLERVAEQRESSMDVETLKQQWSESQISSDKRYSQLEGDMREKIGDMQTEVRRVHDMLKESRAKNAQTLQELEVFQREDKRVARKAEEAGQCAQQAQIRADLEHTRAEQEHDLFVKECEIRQNLALELGTTRIERDNAMTAQKEAEQALEEYKEKIARLEDEAGMYHSKLTKSATGDKAEDDKHSDLTSEDSTGIVGAATTAEDLQSQASDQLLRKQGTFSGKLQGLLPSVLTGNRTSQTLGVDLAEELQLQKMPSFNSADTDRKVQPRQTIIGNLFSSSTKMVGGGASLLGGAVGGAVGGVSSAVSTASGAVCSAPGVLGGAVTSSGSLLVREISHIPVNLSHSRIPGWGHHGSESPPLEKDEH